MLLSSFTTAKGQSAFIMTTQTLDCSEGDQLQGSLSLQQVPIGTSRQDLAFSSIQGFTAWACVLNARLVPGILSICKGAASALEKFWRPG